MLTQLTETFRVSLLGVAANKLRSALTMTGITIGVTAVILLISAGQAVQVYVTNQFTSLGSNLMTVMSTRDDAGRSIPLNMADVEALSNPDNVPDAGIVMATYSVTETGSYEAATASVPVQGVTVDYTALRNRALVSGRFFTQAEYDDKARVGVIGATTAAGLFGVESPVGKSVLIGSVRFQVIGLLNTAGSSGPQDNDDVFLVPLTSALSRLGADRAVTGEYVVSNITVQARDSDSVTAAQSEVESALRITRKVKSGDSDNFRVMSATTILESLTSTIGMLTVFLSVIAGISLLVGGIGVMNIMLVTVTERTREIGLRKAVGAQNGAIVFQFLVESVTLTLLGGGIGVLLAYGGVALARRLIATLPMAVEPASVVLAVVISSAIGIFFGIYPARRAAALNPIDALRYE